MNTRERIALAIFRSEFETHLTSDKQIKRLPTLEALTGEPVAPYLAADWEENKGTYFKHADAAIMVERTNL